MTRHHSRVAGMLAGMIAVLLAAAPAVTFAHSQLEGAQLEGAQLEGAKAEKAKAEKAKAERAKAAKAQAEPARTDGAQADLPPVERSSADRAGTDRQGVERSTAERPTAGQPTAERPTGDRPTILPEDDWRGPSWHHTARGTRVRIGGDVTVDEGERLGDVVAIFGRATVKGAISGNLVAIGGDVELGPNAIVRGDVVAIGGVVRGDSTAVVGGKISEMNLSASSLQLWLPDDGQVTVAFQPDWPWIARLTFISGIMRNLFLFVVCALLLVMAPAKVGRARQQAGASPLMAFAVGFAAELLFVPAMLIATVILAISVIGVPLLALLPVVAIAFGLAMAVGFTAVANGVGGRLVGRATPVGALTLGLALIWGTGMLGRYLWTINQGAFGWGVVLLIVGFAIELLVCTLGLGAALMAWAANRRARVVPAPTPQSVATPEIEPFPERSL